MAIQATVATRGIRVLLALRVLLVLPAPRAIRATAVLPEVLGRVDTRATPDTVDQGRVAIRATVATRGQVTVATRVIVEKEDRGIPDIVDILGLRVTAGFLGSVVPVGETVDILATVATVVLQAILATVVLQVIRDFLALVGTRDILGLE